MKVAISFDKGRVYSHFGKTKEFKVYEIKDDKVIDFYYLKINTEGCSTIIPILKANHINAVIVGTLGENAYTHLLESGIIVFSGVEGEVDDVIGELILGTLKYDKKPCLHHEEECA